jgi:hypothetical protein
VRISQLENTKAEIDILKLCSTHPFLCSMYGHWQDERNVYIAMDFVEGGEMYSHLRHKKRLPNTHAVTSQKLTFLSPKLTFLSLGPGVDAFPLHPFETACFDPLSYSGNPGVNGESDREGMGPGDVHCGASFSFGAPPLSIGTCPCEMRHLPLGCHYDSGVNSQY